MQMKSLSRSQLYSRINLILTYQFSAHFARTFLAPFDEMKFQFSSKTGKLKHILLNNAIQATYRAPYGTFSLSISCAKRMLPDLPAPGFRVQVQTDVSAFIAGGKSVFAKHVTGIDPDAYAYRERRTDEILPWDTITIGSPIHYLLKERERAHGAMD